MIDGEKLVDLYFRSMIHPDLNSIFESKLFSEAWTVRYQILLDKKLGDILNDTEKTRDVLEYLIVCCVFGGDVWKEIKAFCREIFEKNLAVPGYITNNFPEYTEIIGYYSSGCYLTNYISYDSKLFYSPNYSLISDIYRYPEKYIKYLPGSKKHYTTEELVELKDRGLPNDLSYIVNRILEKKKKI